MWHSIEVASLSGREQYKLLTGVVVPRPIALISTVDRDGRANLAPYSFFNVVSHDPALVVVSTAINNMVSKDTQHNIRSTAQFVIGIPSRRHQRAVDICSKQFSPGDDEFIKSGLMKERALKVEPHLIRDVDVNLECILSDQVTLRGGRYEMILGEVVMAHVRGELRNDRGHIDARLLDPLSRLGGRQYSGITEPIQGSPPTPDTADAITERN